MTVLVVSDALGAAVEFKPLAASPLSPAIAAVGRHGLKAGEWTDDTSMAAVAGKHQVSIANVAVRSILDRPAVAGVIVGCRLGVAEHIADNRRVFDLQLDEEDRTQIVAVTRRGRDLFERIGDCGDEYRG